LFLRLRKRVGSGNDLVWVPRLCHCVLPGVFLRDLQDHNQADQRLKKDDLEECTFRPAIVSAWSGGEAAPAIPVRGGSSGGSLLPPKDPRGVALCGIMICSYLGICVMLAEWGGRVSLPMDERLPESSPTPV
jgi:hypothetical protein